MRALGDLIRTYSKSADNLDQMAAVMMGLPPPVLAASGFSAKSAFAFAFRFLVYTQQG